MAQNKIAQNTAAQNEFPSITVFDVNKTLLNITSLEPLFERVFGDRTIMREWFTQLVLYSQTMTLSGLYTPFSELGAGGIQMIATFHHVEIMDCDITELKQRLSNLPAHPDIIPALTRLRDAGFRLVTLTNSPSSTSPTPLEKAGLSEFFERNFSVESVGKFKSAPETYRMVAKELLY